MARLCVFTDGKRCRKRATVAVGYDVPFGQQIGLNGSIQTYRYQIDCLCPDHADYPGWAWPAKNITTITIAEYEGKLTAWKAQQELAHA